MAARPIVIEIPARLDYLVLVRHFICSYAQHVGFDLENVNKIELALDEACANSIRAIQQCEGGAPETLLRLEITQTPNAMSIIVIDNGQCFVEDFERRVSIQDMVKNFKTCGYGLQIIKSCMDDVQYEHLPQEGNRLSLTKFLS